MNKTKLAATLLISFVATSSVVYQIQNRRPVRGQVVGSAPQPAVTNSQAPAPAAVITAAGVRDLKNGSQEKGPAPIIPENIWGRNPFLTPEEIAKLNQPDVPVAVETPKPKPQAEPPALPQYAVTGIITGGQGKWAIIDGRTFRPGERIGTETLKEVQSSAVILEREGRMRELPLKKLEDTAAAAPPKKEANQ
jgi:hypothetical protein